MSILLPTHLLTTGGESWAAYGDGGPEDLHATHPSANKMVRYSCSSGLGDVVLVSPLGLRPVSRCRGDFFLSPGLPAAPGGDPRVHSTMLSRRRHLVRLSPLPCPARPGFLLLMGSQLRRQMDLQTQ
jgi:hypothetical protein